ncbi:MAG: squalene/phytoene synthase family protein [Pseudomonadota bacterium]
MTAVMHATDDDARRHASETVRRSGTSFAAGMRILSRPRREAMYAIYAFCREVDDIADEGDDLEQKRAGLTAWRREVDLIFSGRPETPTGRALLEPVRDFNLSKKEFILIIEGMEIDANGPVVAPSFESYWAYTRRVAGAVGLLSMRAFGAPETDTADRFALSLADALQTTNILRDVGEDAELGRIYLPRELLEQHQVEPNPATLLSAPGLPGVAETLGDIAKTKFLDARKALQALDWRVLRPALLMMGVYEAYLNRMIARGWDRIGETVELSKAEKLMIAARYAIAPPLKPTL